MNRYKFSTQIVTTILLSLTWTVFTTAFPTPQQLNQNVTDSTTTTTPTTINARLTNGEVLELLLAAYLSNLAENTTRAPEPTSTSLQSALLDYENSTQIENLDKDVTNSTDADDLVLPSDVYEVPLSIWINDDNIAPRQNSEEDSIDEAEQIILDALQRETSQQSSPSSEHTIRHRGRRVAVRSANNRRVSEDPLISLPIENVDQNILNLLQRQQQDSGEAMEFIRNRDKFNMTLDYEAPFQNVDSTKLMEIILLMRSDCSQLPRPRKLVRWVSGTRGILFECRNGAWVVTYLSRRQGKPRPSSITDCSEIHEQGVLGLDLERPERPHQLIIHYNNGERKSKEVLCKHDERHNNHQLIDNHINADPNMPVLPVPQVMAGAWTVIQRRESGDTKFYRTMKRYKRGFGSVENGEYWLGLETMHEVTHARAYMLRVEVTGADNNTYFSEYDRFRVGSEAKSYRLNLGSYMVPANNTFSSGDLMTLHHRGKFHTKDSNKFSVNCARLYGTAFWFRGCWAAINLNGPYITSDAGNPGIRWATANPVNEVRRVWKTEMMIKPIL